jgi:hypothetical protein
MDDAVSGHVDGRPAVEELAEHGTEPVRTHVGEILAGQYGFAIVEYPQFQTARSGVDDEDVHGTTVPEARLRRRMPGSPMDPGTGVRARVGDDAPSTARVRMGSDEPPPDEPVEACCRVDFLPHR